MVLRPPKKIKEILYKIFILMFRRNALGFLKSRRKKFSFPIFLINKITKSIFFENFQTKLYIYLNNKYNII